MASYFSCFLHGEAGNLWPRLRFTAATSSGIRKQST